VARLSGFALLVVLVLLDGVAAWLYVSALVEPPCRPPEPYQGIAPPKQVFLTAGEGVKVEAWYYPARNGAAVIALGGQQGAQGQHLPDLSFLVEAGYGVLEIGSRACAEPSALVTLGGREVQDLRAGVRYLRERSEVDFEKIGVFGFSMGGVTAIRGAAQMEAIKAVLAEGGYYNLGADLVGKGENKALPERVLLYSIALTYFARTGLNPWALDALGEIDRISPRPLLLIYGEHELESGKGEDQYQAAGSPKELWVVPGGDHGQNHRAAPKAYQRRVLAFFDETLQPVE
jgi:dipeptidyl aminopeptidase/acylaminoacyl peptidase